MSRSVTVNASVKGYLTLPDGNQYVAGETVILTDDEYAALSTGAKALLDGEEFVSDAPIIASPDGTRYRLVVANGGALSTEVVPE